MIAEKNTMSSLNNLQPNVDTSQTLLTDVTSESKVGRWRLMLWAVATCAAAVDIIFDLQIIILEALSKKSRYGTIPWYIQQAYDFQYGDTLVWQNNQWQYATVTPANQIIKRAAAQELGNLVNIKLAKLSGGIPTKLNSTEFTAASAYYAKKKPAGIQLNIITDDPDELILYTKINFDALLLDNTGQLLSSPGTYPAIDAINNFLTNVIFDGTFELCDYIDALQKATGVKSAYIISASGRYGANPFVSFTERYYPNSGHMKISVANPLTSTLTYFPFN
jgi:hypothetical protein